jgi:hypothetical protein
LELLLEVSSEVCVHKKKHTDTKFPELNDPQLLEFLEQFLANYGGYSADRPTTHNYLHLERCVERRGSSGLVWTQAQIWFQPIMTCTL